MMEATIVQKVNKNGCGHYPIKGQGVIKFVIDPTQNSKVRVILSTELNLAVWNDVHKLELDVDYNKTILKDETGRILKEKNDGLARDKCLYWLSLDSNNCQVIFGKGEVRLETAIMKCELTELNYPWLSEITRFCVVVNDNQNLSSTVTVQKQPIVTQPALRILRTNEITMENVAKGDATVVNFLTTACQEMYATVSGNKFVLNTPDFPMFTEAIQYSINTPGCWCYEKLREKDGEFGNKNFDETYLRITLGKNQGNSPGIPYVMEIWPAEHYSPIHQHANTNAIIRVLTGHIHVKLFSRLSSQETEPFKTVNLGPDEVTWLTMGTNQTHQLVNKDKTDMCITIQCYEYGRHNNLHYEYFDYLSPDNTVIEQFEPASDEDFLKFKQNIQDEWNMKL